MKNGVFILLIVSIASKCTHKLSSLYLSIHKNFNLFENKCDNSFTFHRICYFCKPKTDLHRILFNFFYLSLDL